MTYFTMQDARAFGHSPLGNRSAADILTEQASALRKSAAYDIFLSHSFSDAELILGVKRILEKEGFTVYVDWLEDPHLDRNNVTKETAEYIRARMKACGSLVYATSENARASKWMPWELGFFDGYKPGKVAILPLMNSENDSFKGQEYLSLYPVLGKGLPINFISAPRQGITISDGISTKYFRAA